MKKRVFIDMDGVLAEWLESSIEEVTSKGYFKNLPVIENVVEAVNLLIKREEFEIFILSSVFNDDHSISEKQVWLNNNGLTTISAKNRLFVPYGMTKSLYISKMMGLREDDVLLDDFTYNLKEWHGTGIKMLNGINGTNGTWNGYIVRNNMTSSTLEKQLYGIISVA